MNAKIIVSTVGFGKYLESISGNNDISDDAEILIRLNENCLSFPELGTDEYPIIRAVGFRADVFSIRIEKNRIKKLVQLFKMFSEQPAIIDFYDDDGCIYLSGIGI